MSTYASTDRTCATPLTTEAFGLAVALNPGASTHEVRYAPNATLGADGGIAGNAAKATPDRATGIAQLRFDTPGVYTAVARPTRYTSAGEIGGPWSAPASFVVAAPYDVVGGANGLNFRDSRGPSYAVRFQLREKSTRGKVSVSIARGIRGGRYRSLGTANISRIGSVTKRFTASRSGTYRLRVSYKGSQTTLAGRQTFAIKVRRILAFG